MRYHYIREPIFSDPENPPRRPDLINKTFHTWEVFTRHTRSNLPQSWVTLCDNGEIEYGFNPPTTMGRNYRPICKKCMKKDLFRREGGKQK